MEILVPVAANTEGADITEVSLAALALGMVFVGTCNDEVCNSQSALFCVMLCCALICCDLLMWCCLYAFPQTTCELFEGENHS